MSLKQWVKKLVAGKELVELQAYRDAVEECSVWFSRYDQISLVVQYIRSRGEGKTTAGDIMDLREALFLTKVSDSDLEFAFKAIDALQDRVDHHTSQGNLDKARRYETLIRAFSPFVR